MDIYNFMCDFLWPWEIYLWLMISHQSLGIVGNSWKLEKPTYKLFSNVITFFLHTKCGILENWYEAAFHKHLMKQLFILILQFYVWILESVGLFGSHTLLKILWLRLVSSCCFPPLPAEFRPVECEQKWWVPLPGLAHKKLLHSILHALSPFCLVRMEIT